MDDPNRSVPQGLHRTPASITSILAITAALSLWLPAFGQNQSAAEQLGWTLAVHSYTFQKFSIFDAIDKTAAIGIKHMSISGTVNLLEYCRSRDGAT